LKATGESFDRLEERHVRLSFARQSSREPGRQSLPGQFHRVAKVAACQHGIPELLERDPPQSDVDPKVVVAGLQRIPQCVSRSLRIAGTPQLEPFLEVRLCLLDTAGMDKLESIAGPVNSCELDRSYCGRVSVLPLG
jgi:hypothetical protein